MEGHWQGIDVIDCASMVRLGFMGTLGCDTTHVNICSSMNPGKPDHLRCVFGGVGGLSRACVA